MGRNALYCCSYFELQLDKFVSGDVDLCNSTLLRRFHGRVDVSDWYAVQSLTDALNIRDGVCTLQFSDGTGLSSSHLHSLVICLSTDRRIYLLMAAVVVYSSAALYFF